MVRRCDKNAVGRVRFEELEKRVEHPSDLAHVVCRRAMASERVKLIEQVDTPCLLDRFEEQAELCGSLAEVLGDESIQLDREEREGQLAGKGRCGERFPGPGGAYEKKQANRSQSVLPQARAASLLGDDTLQLRVHICTERHVAEPSGR